MELEKQYACQFNCKQKLAKVEVLNVKGSKLEERLRLHVCVRVNTCVTYSRTSSYFWKINELFVSVR